METIKLLLAHCDRQVNNQIEVAVLDVCYDRAIVQSTRTSRLDELVHQGSLWNFDLVIVGGDGLFLDRMHQSCASLGDVAKGIEKIREQSSTPILALAKSAEDSESLLQAGADVVLAFPFESEELKTELRGLLDINNLVEPEIEDRWSSIGSLLRSGFQRDKAIS